MDPRSNQSEREDDFGFADDDDLPSLHETSFNTASEGYAERYETDTQATSVDGDHFDANSDHPIRSSRQMPGPEYLERKENDSLQQAQRRTGADSDEDEMPPPSYDEAVRTYPNPTRQRPGNVQPIGDDQRDTNMLRDGQPEPTETDPMNHVNGAEGFATSGASNTKGAMDDGLDPTEIALIMKMREGRDSYLPERRGSYEEAVEMLGPEENNSALSRIEVRPEEVDTQIDTVDTHRNGEHALRRSSHNLEAGTDRRSKSSRLVEYLIRQPPQRLLLIGVLVLLVVGLVLFLGLFPASFVYVEYHEIALKQSKMTNVMDREHVYYHGCYVLGPDTQFMRFQASVHNVVDEMNVFTLDTIQLTMRYSAHYFIRPKEVGQLFTMFAKDYDLVFRKIITSSIRTLAGTTFTVDNFRFNRTYIEREIHAMLRRRLGGDCCPSCCPSSCQTNLICSRCRQTSCSLGYHVDLRYFFLMDVTIPEEVFERYLRFTILEIEKEKEFFLQEHAVTTKMTQLLTDQVKNEANEIIAKANAEKEQIAVIADSEREKTVQKSYVEALQKMYASLNVTREDHKLSLMMVRTFEDQADHLYTGYAYDMNTLKTP